MKLLYKIMCVVVFCSLLWSCGTKKNISHTAKDKKSMEELSIDAVLADVENNSYMGETMERKLSLAFGSHSVAGTLRMEKGKRMWLNITPLGISFARAMFTPDSLMYYERIKKTAFEGRWNDVYKVSDKLRVMDYDCLENIFTARPIFSLKKEVLSDEVDENNFVFREKDPVSGFSKFVFVNKETHRVKSQMLISEDEKMGLLAEYEYGEGDNLPSNINFTVLASHQTTLLLTYGAPKTYTPEYPFKVPQGYSDVKKLAQMLGINM
ncbi:MAG: DUF4292 domain-containing protein [Flavobacteriales bacterium]|nr:DUF4292 domain-containing protein [Flavobacteriales bacterium]